MSDFQHIEKKVRKFALDRDWAQFHSPKNLSMALAVECSELMEHFQWLTEPQSRGLNKQALREVGRELADVQIYLIRLSQVLGVDLLGSVQTKLIENARKYPVAKSKGRATKYSKLK